MVLAKQFGRFVLSLSLVSLPGCQLLQLVNKDETPSSVMMSDHEQSIRVINEQMAQYLSEDGRESFLNQMLVALESDNRDRFKGKDPETYSWWNILVQPNQWKEAEIKQATVKGVDTSYHFEFMDVPYRAKTTLHLLAHPDTNSLRVGELSKDEDFNAIAKVEGEPWLLVEQDGMVKGYIHQEYARSNVLDHDILSTKPNELLARSENARQITSKSELFGRYTCRDLVYELTKDERVTTASLRACRKQRKIWYIDVPETNTKPL
ncbi:SH3 domain-containing protein [Vibrio alfacsensis]|uniref:SH3 domain-containing protein n=1 Tax=Vibrio alfacsensis TaxID=1074311 RepID=UPI001BF11C17|nr:SH3 domain-containing protein [Vibrio alfacsensis]BCN23131.1 hypothetical protein VYA_03230 [Vibrio alfacsensis]